MSSSYVLAALLVGGYIALGLVVRRYTRLTALAVLAMAGLVPAFVYLTW